MNATAEHLDQFLCKTDPVTARTLEQIVNLLIARFKAAPPPNAAPPKVPVPGTYKMKTYAMGGILPGIDPYKLGQLPEEF